MSPLHVVTIHTCHFKMTKNNDNGLSPPLSGSILFRLLSDSILLAVYNDPSPLLSKN